MMGLSKDNKTYSADALRRYHSGLMSDAEMHEIERAALEDPFLEDALDGYGLVKEDEENLQALRRHIETRQQRHESASTKKMSFIWWKIAAVLLFTAIISYVFTRINDHQQMHVASADTTLPQQKIEPVITTPKHSNPLVNQPATTPVAVNATKNRPEKVSATKKADQPARELNATTSVTEIELLSDVKSAAPDVQLTQASAHSKKSAMPTAGRNDNLSKEMISTSELQVLGKKEHSDQSHALMFSSMITDADGYPLAGVRVIPGAGGVSALTDRSGKFSLVAPDTSLLVKISARDYISSSAWLFPDTNQTIVLYPDTK